MTKFSVTPAKRRPAASERPGVPRQRQRDPALCSLYEPGHLIHYKHQGDAVRSTGRSVRDSLLDGNVVTLILVDGTELEWRHHDPERLGRVLELLRGRVTAKAYLHAHALRVGPYWFNCADVDDPWEECRGEIEPT